MKHKICLLFTFYVIFGVSQAADDCPNTDKFAEANPNFLSKDYLKYKKKNNNNFLPYIEENSNLLDVGVYGEIFELFDPAYSVMKKVAMQRDKGKDFYMNEIKMLRYICKHEKERYSEVLPCNSNAIPEFKGCILENDTIYQFHDLMDWGFSKGDAINTYRKLPPQDRVRIMLDIIDRFIELHNLKVIHSDIKPENIMLKSKNFSDIRIIDFGFAGFAGKDYISGTQGYIAPEIVELNYKGLLSPKNDIFALAMTFAELEGNFREKEVVMDGDIQRMGYKRELSEKEIEIGLVRAFIVGKGLSVLLPVMIQAAAYNKDLRYSSMIDLSNAIFEKFITLDGSEPFLIDLLENANNEGQERKFSGYWRKKAAIHFGLFQQQQEIQLVQQQQAQPNNDQGGFSDWFARKVLCSCSKKKKKQNVQNPMDQLNNNNPNAQNIIFI